MAVRFDSSEDKLQRTSSPFINYQLPYTWMGWFYLVSDLNARSYLMTIGNSAPNSYDSVYLATADGVTLSVTQMINWTEDEVTGTALAVGRWYHIAMVRSSISVLSVYLNGMVNAVAKTTSMSGRGAPVSMEVGNFSSDWGRADARVSRMKAWSRALSTVEIRREMQSVMPVCKDSLWGFWPVFGGSDTQRGVELAFGRNMDDGWWTLTDEADPPVPWSIARPPTTFADGLKVPLPKNKLSVMP